MWVRPVSKIWKQIHKLKLLEALIKLLLRHPSPLTDKCFVNHMYTDLRPTEERNTKYLNIFWFGPRTY